MKNIRRFLSYIRPSIGYFIFGIVFATIFVGLTLYIPMVIGDIIDLFVVGNVPFETIYQKLFIILGCLIGVAVFTYLYELSMSHVTQMAVKQIRNDLFYKMNHVPVSYIDQHQEGDLVSRSISDVETVADGILEGFKQLYQGIITILFTLVFMFIINWLLALVVVVVTPLSIFAASFIAKRSHKYFKAQSQIKGEVGAYVLEMMENGKIVKELGYEKEAVEKFDVLADQLYDTGVKAVFMGATTNPTTRFINGIVYALVGIVGAILFINNDNISASLVIGISELSSFLIYSNQYTKPFNEVSSVVTEFQSALASLARIFEVLDQEDEKEVDEVHIESDVDTIALNHVYFAYQPERPLITNFHFTIHKGQHIAIVGPTGCGKTTLINLLMRFYDVNQGDILLNDQSIYQMTRHELRSHYGMVLQDTWIFEGTILENVAYGKENTTREEIIEACKKAHAHGFIKRLSNGYDTKISSKSGLSQGERQLITIARVMLRMPEIVILDEATSSIDTRTEKKISDAFNTMMEGRTSFIIAHRLSTIRNADAIFVMKDGNIIEVGTHDELLKKKGFYAELYFSQFAEEE